MASVVYLKLLKYWDIVNVSFTLCITQSFFVILAEQKSKIQEICFTDTQGKEKMEKKQTFSELRLFPSHHSVIAPYGRTADVFACFLTVTMLMFSHACQ